MDLNGVQGIEADLLDHHSLHEAMEGVDTVYSMASPMPGTDADFMRVNTEGVSNLLEVAREAKVKSFVHLSTMDVYGSAHQLITAESEPKPQNDYQRSKLAADNLVLESAKQGTSPRVTVLRAAKAVGSRDTSLVVPILKMVEAGSVNLPSAGMMSFSHPLDIAEAMYRSATNPRLGKSLYLIKSFDATPEELAVSIRDSLGRKSAVKKEGVFSGSRMPPYTREQLKSHLILSPQPAWSELGYAPRYDLRTTCDDIAQWYKKNPWATEQD
jgi:nucleoside-diphosphate-sugar epimerase